MKHIKRFSEDIKIPIEVGDTILGGRFKNKKTVVKKIGKNQKGDITINDKPLLKYRIVKESIGQEDINNELVYLIDDGFQVIKENFTYYDVISIFKQKEFRESLVSKHIIFNMAEVKWSDIEADLLPFIEKNKDCIKDISITIPLDDAYDRISYTADRILEDNIKIDKIVKINIIIF